MVWRHLVRDEIEQKPESPLGQFRPRGNQAFAASKVRQPRIDEHKRESPRYPPGDNREVFARNLQ
jgi:hypothetical protein